VAINKIIKQNNIINKKIENLLMVTERIEERIDKVETNNTNNIDQTFVEVCNITLYYICYLIIIIMYI
jgi:hypothetical protein